MANHEEILKLHDMGMLSSSAVAQHCIFNITAADKAAFNDRLNSGTLTAADAPTLQLLSIAFAGSVQK
jgi:hypothetical protein